MSLRSKKKLKKSYRKARKKFGILAKQKCSKPVNIENLEGIESCPDETIVALENYAERYHGRKAQHKASNPFTVSNLVNYAKLGPLAPLAFAAHELTPLGDLKDKLGGEVEKGISKIIKTSGNSDDKQVEEEGEPVQEVQLQDQEKDGVLKLNVCKSENPPMGAELIGIIKNTSGPDFYEYKC